MSTVIPIDEFVGDAWYPGFRPGYMDAAWITERAGTFTQEDEKRFWFIDFHWPNGFTPMGCIYLEDAYSWGLQLAARQLPLPPGNGLVPRIVGVHVYGSEALPPSGFEIAQRAERIGTTLPQFLENFPAIWAERVRELESGLHYFESHAYDGKPLAELAQLLVDARAFNKRAWEIHFEIMYPLLANYLGFYGMCGELGIPPVETAKFLQGYDTKMMECDRALWTLAKAARGTLVEQILAETPPERLQTALRAAGSATQAWLVEFDAMLAQYGMRTEGIADPMLAPWCEDPTPALGTIKSFLGRDGQFDFEAGRRAAAAERDEAVERARQRLTDGERQAFDQALASCRHANFPWWNEDHNFYIDLRATTPVRMACLAIGRTLGLDDPTDTLFCFHKELVLVAQGALAWSEVQPYIQPRRDYYRLWNDKRSAMPKVLGTVPETVMDPVMIEIFGIHKYFLAAARLGSGQVQQLTGMAVSSGVGRGRARVLHDASLLHTIAVGDILVCEGTTPSWTPAFTKVAACVCDGGGTLTHASIISREYRVPCVVGVGMGTSAIKDGDEVEVDGNSGIVTILKRAAAAHSVELA